MFKKTLFSLLCLGVMAALSYNFFSIGGDDLPGVSSYYDGPLFNNELDTGVTCSPAPPGVIRDDGSYENGYRSVSTGDSTTMVHKMVLGPGSTIVAVCWTWTALSPSGSLTHDIVVYDTTGAGDSPGSLVGRIAGVMSPSIAIFPSHSRYRSPTVAIGPLPNRSYYIGVKWNNNPVLPFFSSADENGTFGGPGYQRVTTTFPPVWQNINTPFPAWKNWSYRVELAPPNALPTFCECAVNTYVPITGTAGPSGDDVTVTVPIGWTFTHVGVAYTNISICTNGFVVMGTSAFNSFTPALCGTVAGQLPMIAPLWTDLNTATSGAITYTSLGTAPNRIFVVQYANVGFFDGGAGRVTMQILLYENGVSGPTRVEFHYGAGVTDPTPEAGSVGMSKTPGGSGNVISLTPVATCAPTISTTSCNDAVPYNTTNFPANRKYVFLCVVGVPPVTNGIPHEYNLSQNYPNPFNPSTKISFSLPKAGLVTLKVFDILGREVYAVVNSRYDAGNHETIIDMANFSSGIYFYKLEAGDFSATKKMMLIK